MNMKQMKTVLYAVNILAGLAMVAAGVSAAYAPSAFAPSYELVSPGSAAAAPVDVGRTKSPRYYSSCWTTGNPRPALSRKKEEITPPAPVPSGKFKLYSTFFIGSGPGREAFAAISFDNSDGVYTQGEEVGGYVLSEIFPDRVILKKGEQSFTLDRTEAARAGSGGRSASKVRSRTSKRTSSRTTPRSSKSGSDRNSRGSAREVTGGAGGRTAGGDAAGIDRAGTDNRVASSRKFTVSKKDRDYAVENFGKILHDVNLQTEMSEEDGSMTGVRIGYIKKGSLLARIGHLKAGDIIRKVNGRALNSVREAVSLYDELTMKNAKRINVQIERDGALMNFNYSIGD